MSAKGKIAAMLAVAMADGRIDKREAQLLAAFGARLGLSISEITDVIDNPTPHIDEFPTSPSERKQLFRDMVAMSAIDGNVDTSEVKVVCQIGAIMGMSPEEVKQVLDRC